MYPVTHFLFAMVVGSFFQNQGLITGKAVVFAGIIAILIDFDHYFVYLRRHKKMDFSQAWKASSEYKEYNKTLLHSNSGIVVTTLLIILLGILSPVALIILGCAYWSHIMLDIINLALYKKYKITKLGMNISAVELSLNALFLVLLIVLSPVSRSILGLQ